MTIDAAITVPELLPFPDVANLLPIMTRSGTPSIDLLIRHPNNSTPEGYRAARARLFHAALDARLSRQQAASVVWGANAGSELRSSPDGLERLWLELQEAENAPDLGTHSSAPELVTLLTNEERPVTAARTWWGSQYLQWARRVTPADAGSSHRLHRWNVLSRAFSDLGVIPKIGGAIHLDLPSVAVGGRLSGRLEAREPMRAVLRALRPQEDPLGDLASQSGQIEFQDADEVLAARSWAPGALAQFVWAFEPAAAETAESLVEDQLEDSWTRQFGSMPSQLAMQLADAQDRLTTAFGEAPYPMLMEQDALDRHSSFKLTLSRVLSERRSSVPMAFADSIRKCATLVAMSEGARMVTLEHELIALEQAEEWLGNLLWLIERAESAEQDRIGGQSDSWPMPAPPLADTWRAETIPLIGPSLPTALETSSLASLPSPQAASPDLAGALHDIS